MMCNDIVYWRQSQQIREFVAAVRAKPIEKHGEITPGGELDRWIIWANQQSDRLDPFVNETPSTPAVEEIDNLL